MGVVGSGCPETEKNLKQAIFWYAKAAQQGFIAAQYKLATIYHSGRGVEVDDVKELNCAVE
jgi:TPR repeat protein